jgi:hypothetical protein
VQNIDSVATNMRSLSSSAQEVSQDVRTIRS